MNKPSSCWWFHTRCRSLGRPCQKTCMFIIYSFSKLVSILEWHILPGVRRKCNNLLCDYSYILEKQAALTDAPKYQCVLSQAEMTASGAVDITRIFQDSDPTSCLRLADKTGTQIRILISLVPYRVVSVIYVIGKSLNCGPLAGMRMSIIYRCESGKCAAMCTPGEFLVTGMRTGCRYVCHCFGICQAVVLDVYKFTDNSTDLWEICEIVI